MSHTPDFEAAVAAGLITPDQATKLSDFYRAQAAAKPIAVVDDGAVAAMDAATPRSRFDLAHMLWYFGALIIIGAMGMFTTLGFMGLGAGFLFVVAIVYAAGFTLAGHYLWRSKGLTTPGGLLITVAVAMTPLAVYAAQETFEWWGKFGDPGNYRNFYQLIKGGWLPMEIGTLIAALVAIRFYPFGFIAMIAAMMLWFMSMDIAPWIAGAEKDTWEMRRTVTMWFGLGLMAFAWLVDVMQRKADYAFWLHLAGIAAFWGGFGGVTFLGSHGELEKFLYLLLNVALLGFAVFLSRRVYAVFGAFGVCAYLGYLSSKLFMDSILFPIVLSAIGLGVIALGLLYHRNAPRIAAAFERHTPEALKALRPRAAL